jgi:CheY-like chemotaxis protein
MGGTIQVKSKPGEGSEFCFTVELPFAPDWAEQQRKLEGEFGKVFPKENDIIGYEGEHYRILVVDDRWENRIVIQNLLAPLGFELIEAENGEVGLAQLRDYQPDLVITDLTMPVMDGFDFLRHIRNSDELKNTRVIVSSASVSQKDQRMALDNGGNDFLAKPVHASTLFTLLANHLQLTWIYETKDDTVADSKKLPAEKIVPSRQILEALLKSAQEANMKALRTQLTELTASEQAYTPFAAPLLQLSRKFEAEEIEELLQKYMT